MDGGGNQFVGGFGDEDGGEVGGDCGVFWGEEGGGGAVEVYGSAAQEDWEIED